MQPTQFRLTVNGTGASIIREDYSYYADGSVTALTDLDDTAGSNPPVSLRFLSRAYSYDHVGRVTSGFGTGNAGQGVPFNQNYTYDSFGNITVRSGSYYNYNFSGPTSDTATYTKNRRTNWSYNSEGQVTSTPLTSTDRPRTMTYDAAGRMVSSLETGQSNTVTYSASYDGDGQLVYESSNTSPGSFTAAYIVRSTVLGGEVLTRLDQSGKKLTTHVPAEGLVFATQRSSGAPGPFVMTTYRNPLGITETTKAVYDPLGNYIPFQAHGDPRPPVGSYSSASMSGLASSQANPDSYGVGCIMDGMPTSCSRVIRVLSRGQAKELQIHGVASNPATTFLMMSLTQTRAFFVDSDDPPDQPTEPTEPTAPGPGFQNSIGSEEFWTEFIMAPGLQRGFEQNPQKPIMIPLGNLRANMENMLKGDCLRFTTDLLARAAKLFAGDDSHLKTVMEGYDKITSPGQGGYVFKTAGFDTVSGDLFAYGANPGTVELLQNAQYRTPTQQEIAFFQQMYAWKAIHETLHLGKQGSYDDEQLAVAAYSLARKDMQKVPDSVTGLARASIFSARLDTELKKHCPQPKQPTRR